MPLGMSVDIYSDMSFTDKHKYYFLDEANLWELNRQISSLKVINNNLLADSSIDTTGTQTQSISVEDYLRLKQALDAGKEILFQAYGMYQSINCNDNEYQITLKFTNADDEIINEQSISTNDPYCYDMYMNIEGQPYKFDVIPIR